MSVELWVPGHRVSVGAWLTAHVRVRNVGTRVIWANCAPISTYADFAPLFDRGVAWTGVAARFKQELLDEGFARQQFGYSTGEGIDCPGGDIGRSDRLRPGESWDIDLKTLPRYFVADQAYPAGTLRVTTALGYGFHVSGELSRSLGTDALVDIAGRPFPGASPLQLIDAALATPGLVEWLETRDPDGWVNMDISAPAWSKAIEWPLFGFTGPAPNGTITIGFFADGPGSFLGEVLLDPWTAQSFGFLAR